MPLDTIYVSLNSAGRAVANPDSLAVDREQFIVWKNTSAKIEWIRIVPPPNLFMPPPPSGDWSKNRVQILKNAPSGVYKYSIAYKKGGIIDTLDPKIAVKPSGTNPTFFIVFIMLALSLFTMFSFGRVQHFAVAPRQ